MAQTELVLKSDPDLVTKVKKLGAKNIDVCFNCGNCTATCPLSSETTSFPRKMITYTQLGLEKKLLQSPDPWLCYYCGDCSKSCPRQAEPAETMMAIRRYLTTKYDWTGISKAIYLSKPAKYVSTIALSLITILLVWLFHGPVITSSVQLTTFAPVGLVSNAGLIFGGVLAIILISNLARMYWFTVKKSGSSKEKISLSKYAKEFRNVIVQFFTQKRYSSCNDKKAWRNHLILMWGYTVLFILYGLLLSFSMFNKLPPIADPIKLTGYFGFAALMYGVVYAIVGRLKKTEPSRRFSQATDWMFLILLLMTSVSGILLDLFVGLNMPLAVYTAFTIHLAIVVPLLGLEVPFAKWSHLAYRPLGLYFSKLETR